MKAFARVFDSNVDVALQHGAIGAAFGDITHCASCGTLHRLPLRAVADHVNILQSKRTSALFAYVVCTSCVSSVRLEAIQDTTLRRFFTLHEEEGHDELGHISGGLRFLTKPGAR